MKIVAANIVILLACLIFVWVPRARAQTDAIPSEVRQKMVLFLQALNSGDPAKIEKFVRENHHPKVVEQVPMDMFLARWLTVHQQSGPVEARIFKNLSPTASIVWTRGTITQAWTGFQFIYEKETPHRLTTIGRDSGPLPPLEERLLPAKNLRDLVDRVNKYVSAIDGTPYFSGSVLIAHRGIPIFSRSLGVSSQKTGTPNRNDTIYNIASVSKMILGVAVAQLVEKRKLRYDDPLSKFIPEYPGSIADRVTIHHLLTHTSGIELDDIPEFNQRLGRAKNVKEMVDAQIEFLPQMEGFKDFKLPGEYNYSNEGYALLARIVEVVSGDSYFDYLRKNIFRPARMISTNAFAEGTKRPSHPATGYTNQNPTTGVSMLGPPREVSPWLYSFRSPAGGVDSTTGDLLRFTNALFRGDLVKKPSVGVITHGHVSAGEDFSYGYGFANRQTIAGKRLGHDGANMGFSSRLDHYPDSGYTVIVLSNRDRNAGTMADLIAELLGTAKMSQAK